MKMKKILVISVLACFLVVPQLASASVLVKPSASEITLSDWYSNNTVDIEQDVNPIGKVVKFKEGKNIKPLIAEKANQHNQKQKADAEVNPDRIKKIDNYFTKIAAGKEQKFTKHFFDFLEENGLVYYELGKQKEKEVAISSTTGADVSVNSPWVSYDSVNNTWEVWGGYSFTNDWSWWGERNMNVATQIGNLDTVGIHLTTANNAALLSGFFAQGLYHDAPCSGCSASKSGQNSETITSRWGTIDSNNGAMFKLSDKIDSWGGGYAMRWGAGAVKLKYNSTFSSAHGLATVYFAHTWNSGSIDSVTATNSSFTIAYSTKSQTTDTLIGGQYSY